MPGETGVTVVTTLVCFVLKTACEAAGALSARHSLRPLNLWGEEFMQTSGASRRGNANVYLNVIARSDSDEAIQLPFRRAKSWIASLRSQ